MFRFWVLPFAVFCFFVSGCANDVNRIVDETVVNGETTETTEATDSLVDTLAEQEVIEEDSISDNELNPGEREEEEPFPGVNSDSDQVPIADSIQQQPTDENELEEPEQNANQGLTIYFIRHAETVANATGNRGGQSMEGHNEFSELGYQQVDSLKNFLIENSINPDVIIVSPAWRAQKTIEPYLLETQQTAEIWVELNECCGGEPTGTEVPSHPTVSRLEAGIEAENTVFRNSEDVFYWFPQTYEEGLFMVMTAVDSLLTRYSQTGKTVMLIGHAAHGRIFTGLIRGYNMLNEFPQEEIFLRNIGIHRFRQDPETGEISLDQQNINFPRWWE